VRQEPDFVVPRVHRLWIKFYTQVERNPFHASRPLKSEKLCQSPPPSQNAHNVDLTPTRRARKERQRRPSKRSRGASQAALQMDTNNSRPRHNNLCTFESTRQRHSSGDEEDVSQSRREGAGARNRCTSTTPRTTAPLISTPLPYTTEKSPYPS
jgi:hypothetical protein